MSDDDREAQRKLLHPELQITSRADVHEPVAGNSLRHRINRARRAAARKLTYGGLDVADATSDIHYVEENTRFVVSDPLFVTRALQFLRPGPDDVFVDFGAGKGAVLAIAGRHPFRRIVGVEVDPALVATAEQNLAKKRGRLQSNDIELVTANVLDFEIPSDMTIAYFYLPFVGQTFRTVLERIIASYDAHPRRIALIYAAPVERRLIADLGRFRNLTRFNVGVGSELREAVEIYEVTPGSAAPPRRRGPRAV